MAADTPFTYWFWVDHVHDGDTIMGKLDMGLQHYLGGLPALQPYDPTGAYYSLRLYGINAPELNSTDAAVRAAARASLANLQSLVKPGDYLKVVSMGWDKYQMRIDAIPYTTTGIDCCKAQLDGGFAVPYTP
jgi:endonuclease YncB( thermonuclease family)